MECSFKQFLNYTEVKENDAFALSNISEVAVSLVLSCLLLLSAVGLGKRKKKVFSPEQLQSPSPKDFLAFDHSMLKVILTVILGKVPNL